jgi:hypothetical protein
VVAELVGPPGELEAGVVVALSELPAGGDEFPDVAGDVPVVEVSEAEDAADLLGALDGVPGDVRGDLGVVEFRASYGAC